MKLGELIPKDEDAQRDAIHIAVAPVVATEELGPGVPVRFIRNSVSEVRQCDFDDVNFIGVVDPFLKDWVNPGDRFYVYLKPNTITALRHEWTHPAFDPPVQTDQARIAAAVAAKLMKTKEQELLEEFADDIGISYERLLDEAQNYQATGEYLNEGPRFEGVCIPNGFWEAYEQVTGEVVSDPSNFFSCSC